MTVIDYEVGIVGAGFGGLIAGTELKRTGRNSFIIFERACGLGGVWRDNIYPGCSCDVRSHLYSLKRFPYPEWSTSYAAQKEILAYMERVALAADLQAHLRFNTTIDEARFLEKEACWLIRERAGRTWRVKTLILATGPQSRPLVPGIPGAGSFRGLAFHSSAWNQSVRLEGKRVAVIGTGASAVQIVPNIASKVAQLDLYQRTPHWVLPRFDRRITHPEKWLLRSVPGVQRVMRGAIYWSMELIGRGFLGNEIIRRILTAVALCHLRIGVRSRVDRERLRPCYKLGCKRVLLSDDFYPTLNRDHVNLIFEPIVEIVPEGVRTADGKTRPTDCIVFATGFIVAETDGYLHVVGRDGRVLVSDWDRNGVEAFLGMQVSGYPGLMLLLGPNSGIGHSSVLQVIESQIKYVLSYLEVLDQIGPDTLLDVRPEVQARYNREIQQRFHSTVWGSGCRSWYINRNGANVAIFPGLTSEYRSLADRVNLEHYSLQTAKLNIPADMR